VTKFEEPVDFRDGYLPTARGLPIVPTIETTALLAVLLAYAVGFAILYPIAKMDVVKSVSTSAAPALMEVVGH
jgi:hypothetical protein